MLRLWIAASLAVLLLVPFARADMGPPDPISLDRESPSVNDFGFATPGEIYDMPGGGPLYPAGFGLDYFGPGPITHVFEGAYGLQPMQDNNDAHSNGETTRLWDEETQLGEGLMLYFSADDKSKGLPGTDYDNQAQLMQAAGDRYIVNGVVSAPGMPGAPATVGPPPFGLPLYTSGAGGTPINILNANQHRYHEIPSVLPNVFNPYVPQRPNSSAMDDMDALELTAMDWDGDQVHDTNIYFSLDPPSPTLGMIGGMPADILLSPGPGPSGPYVWAPAPSMGLDLQGLSDDVDALAVWDVGQYQGDQAEFGLDFALFSLAPQSPYLAGPDGAWGTPDDYSAADIFATNFTGTNWLFLTANQIGMMFEDNVDAIDVESEIMWEEEWPLDMVAPLSTIQFPTADSDGDGDVDLDDLMNWQRGHGKLGPGLSLLDGDFLREDIIVDGADLSVWTGMFTGHPLAAVSAVPEPASMTLFALALAALGGRRKR